jgi:hypothetical protein
MVMPLRGAICICSPSRRAKPLLTGSENDEALDFWVKEGLLAAAVACPQWLAAEYAAARPAVEAVAKLVWAEAVCFGNDERRAGSSANWQALRDFAAAAGRRLARQHAKLIAVVCKAGFFNRSPACASDDAATTAECGAFILQLRHLSAGGILYMLR